MQSVSKSNILRLQRMELPPFGTWLILSFYTGRKRAFTESLKEECREALKLAM